ncbi:hypothetical protein Droror1_Dr00014026 [Drosera rotundifolia]
MVSPPPAAASHGINYPGLPPMVSPLPAAAPSSSLVGSRRVSLRTTSIRRALMGSQGSEAFARQHEEHVGQWRTCRAVGSSPGSGPLAGQQTHGRATNKAPHRGSGLGISSSKPQNDQNCNKGGDEVDDGKSAWKVKSRSAAPLTNRTLKAKPKQRKATRILNSPFLHRLRRPRAMKTFSDSR